jgi:hypothetical protein
MCFSLCCESPNRAVLFLCVLLSPQTSFLSPQKKKKTCDSVVHSCLYSSSSLKGPSRAFCTYSMYNSKEENKNKRQRNKKKKDF